MFGGGKSARVRFDPTDRSERIAGIQGEAYRYDQDGGTHEVVLGRNRDLSLAVRGVTEMIRALLGTPAADKLMQQVRQGSSMKGMGMLRFDHSVRLVSVRTGRISDSAFELPEKVMRISGDGSAVASRYQSGRVEQGKRSESVVEKDAKDIGTNSINEARQSTINLVKSAPTLKTDQKP